MEVDHRGVPEVAIDHALPETCAKFALSVGDTIAAYFEDVKEWYTGTVQSVEQGGEVAIQFSDGEIITETSVKWSQEHQERSFRCGACRQLPGEEWQLSEHGLNRRARSKSAKEKGRGKGPATTRDVRAKPTEVDGGGLAEQEAKKVTVSVLY